jgi:hypothetical protein
MAGLQPRPEPGHGPGSSYLRFVPSAELEQIKRDREEVERTMNSPIVIGLFSHLEKRWERAKQAKEVHQRHLLENLRQFIGQYDPEELAAIRETGGSEIFMLLTQVKCRAASAWLKDVLLPGGTDRAWRAEPTPIPEVPPDIVAQLQAMIVEQAQQMMSAGQGMMSQEAALQQLQSMQDQALQQMRDMASQRAERMERKMDDQLEEGGWRIALSEFIDDFTLYPFAVMKGPVMRKRKRLSWDVMSISGNPGIVTPMVEERLVHEWERRSPFDIYPSPGARTIQDGYLFDLYRLAPSELEAMIGVEGYNDKVIERVLDEYGEKGHEEVLHYDNERQHLQGRPHEDLAVGETIDSLNYWGSAQGKMLMEWDPKGDVIGEEIDPAKSYQIEAWKVGRYIIKAVLNPDPLGMRPYSLSSYIKRPGHLAGMGIADAIRDDQKMLNASARTLSNNMGLASGPQIAINDVSRLPDGEDIASITPWKIWQFGPDRTSPTGGRQPIEFFQPNPMVRELLALFDHFARAADEHAAIPAYVHGGSERVQGAGKTASGLAMLMGQASKGLKLVMGNIDMDVLEPRIRALYYHNMLYDPDHSIKGDLIVKARGSSALLVREQRQIRLNEFLQLVGNEMALGILGVRGYAALLREAGKDLLDLPINSVIPSDDMLAQREQEPAPDPLEAQKLAMEQLSQQKEMEKAQAENLKQTNEAQKLALEEARIKDEAERWRAELASREAESQTQRSQTFNQQRRQEQTKETEKADADVDQLLRQLEAVEGELITKQEREDQEEATAKQLEAVSKDLMGAITDMAKKLEKSSGDVEQKIDKLTTSVSQQEEEMEESAELRDKIIAHLKKNGSKATKDLLAST